MLFKYIQSFCSAGKLISYECAFFKFIFFFLHWIKDSSLGQWQPVIAFPPHLAKDISSAVWFVTHLFKKKLNIRFDVIKIQNKTFFVL